MSIAENVKRLRARMDEATVRSGRQPGSVALVAAAKTNDASKVREAIAAGVDAVGENRVQELLEKMEQGAYTGCPLHFIGHLQGNKVRNVVGSVGLIESVGSETLLKRIDARAVSLGIVQDLLIEVNIGRETAKSGIMPEETAKMLGIASNLAGINVLGLMAIPPISEEKGASRHYFDAMYKLFVDMSAKKYDNVSMRILSMGMSDSFEEAIEAGANMIRVGSAIFGKRN